MGSCYKLLDVASYMAVRYSCRPVLKLALDDILALPQLNFQDSCVSEIVVLPTIFLPHIL